MPCLNLTGIRARYIAEQHSAFTLTKEDFSICFGEVAVLSGLSDDKVIAVVSTPKDVDRKAFIVDRLSDLYRG